ncbi:unnamed protein product, partial [Lymnaea stagnalis]
NILALVIFWKTGLGDGISVCFFSLTVSDLLCLVTFLAATLLGMLDLNFNVKPYVSLYWVSYVVPFYALMFYNISIVTIVVLAIQKCCCVAMPLKFKDTFSRGRSIAFNVCIYCGIMITFIPFTAITLPFRSNFDTSTNSTRLVFYLSKLYLTEIFPVLKAINYISIPIISEIVVLFCTILLTIRLRQSLKFRSSAAVRGADKRISVQTREENRQLSSSKSNRDRYYTTSLPSKLKKLENRFGFPKNPKQPRSDKNLTASKNEFRVTQAVNLVATIFVLSNSPDVVVFFASLVVPEFSGLGQYRHTYTLCIELQDLLHIVNMSVNLFVYLKFNSRFRKIFLSTF